MIVISGKDRGRQGKVLRVDPKNDKVFVEGLNIIKRHQKAQQNSPTSQQQGGIIEREAGIHLSNVALVDPKDGKATRVGIEVIDGQRVRVARRSGTRID